MRLLCGMKLDSVYIAQLYVFLSMPEIINCLHGQPPNFRGCVQAPWAYDFMFDACSNGQQLKCLTAIDEYTHESPDIDVAGSIRSERVVEVLSQLISVEGAPTVQRSDNGRSCTQPEAILEE